MSSARLSTYLSRADVVLNSITIAVGILVIIVLPDFPDTWNKLSPELKHIANRRMAIDAAEADVDVGGKMSYLHGAKLAFTDPKVSAAAVGLRSITNGCRRICSQSCTMPLSARPGSRTSIPHLLRLWDILKWLRSCWVSVKDAMPVW